jgi:hypothetical protein
MVILCPTQFSLDVQIPGHVWAVALVSLCPTQFSLDVQIPRPGLGCSPGQPLSHTV